MAHVVVVVIFVLAGVDIVLAGVVVACLVVLILALFLFLGLLEGFLLLTCFFLEALALLLTLACFFLLARLFLLTCLFLLALLLELTQLSATTCLLEQCWIALLLGSAHLRFLGRFILALFVVLLIFLLGVVGCLSLALLHRLGGFLLTTFIVGLGMLVVDSIFRNLLLDFLLVEFIEIAEVFLKGSSFLEQQVEVVLADDDIVGLLRDVLGIVFLPHTAIVVNLAIVGKSLDNNQSEVAKCHGFELEVLDDKRLKVVLCNLIEQLVRRNRVGREHEHKVLWLVAPLGEWGELLALATGSGVVRKSHRPQHATGVGRATIDFAALIQLLDNGRGCGCDVGLGIALKHLLDSALELLGVALGDIGERIDEHELRHDFRQRIGLHHLDIGCMDCGVVVVEVGSVGLVVELFLNQIHALEVLEVVGVLHSKAISRLGEVVENQLPVPFRSGEFSAPVVKQIHIIICVEAVGVVGISLK